MSRRPSQYKPLLFTTTMRNPERLKRFLSVLREFDGKVLSSDLTKRIAARLIKYGLYRPLRLSQTVKDKYQSGQPLSDKEAERVLKDNPQNHKEAGFERGWPSRFDTWFKIAKELGFVYYAMGKKIAFSEVGRRLVDETHPELEQQAFLNAFVKYQSNNPFRRVLNENVPLVLLLQVIQLLNSDRDFNSTGISKRELPLLIYWPNSDAPRLYKRIRKLRKEYGYDPSDEILMDICRNEIMEGRDIRRDSQSILVDYPDDFIRKMRLTGLVTLRGAGRFIDINRNEAEKVRYILKKHARYSKYESEQEFFDYISEIDKNLITTKSKKPKIIDREKYLVKWMRLYSWENIKSELLILVQKRFSNDRILKYLSNPVRLEFLVALAIKTRFPSVRVRPNYPVDDEGLPTAPAGGVGDRGDIECFEELKGVLVEVTLAEGRVQTVAEVWPITRHLEEFQKKRKDSMCYFVAPGMYKDTMRQINFVVKEENYLIVPKTIREFVSYLETSRALHPSSLPHSVST